MANEYFTDKTVQPTDQEMADAIGGPVSEAWTELRRFLVDTYAVDAPLQFGGGEWFMRYKRGSRPLCELVARKGCFRALVVLGKQEVAQVMERIDSLGPNVRRTFEGAKQFHDGRWLFVLVEDPQECKQDVRDLELLVQIKVRPPRKKAG
jgi:hypothetical protein